MPSHLLRLGFVPGAILSGTVRDVAKKASVRQKISS
jgi:hypothetical protein